MFFINIYLTVGGFIFFDILTGFLKALKHKKLESKKIREGLYHKAGEILTLLGCYLLKHVEIAGFPFNIDLLLPFSLYVCGMELLSILENLAEINPVLKIFFDKYLKKGDEKK